MSFQVEKGLRDVRMRSPGRDLIMGIDVSRILADDNPDNRLQADLPRREQAAESSVQTDMRLPSTAERSDAHRDARLAADNAYAESIGDEISKGHAFDKHVIKLGEFPGVATREQFARVIRDAVMNGESRALNAGRTAYWSDGTVVIRNPSSPDGGTTLRPKNGYDYFVGLH
jgi:hypothetical protein